MSLNAMARPATDVRAVFSWSYHTLTPEAARLFRLLGAVALAVQWARQGPYLNG
jgi:hypothetical protein